MALQSGTRIGPYEVTGTLGAGGMGEVYRARDKRLKRDVALKILPESFAGDSARLARFQREAEVLASLNHPNVAAIHGLEESDSTRALVMELVDGETLADRIARGPIPIDEALPITRQIAEALEAAHEQGIIHRDLKPANIKVRPDGTVKVLDFGLAKAMEPNAGASASTSHSPTITSPAMMTGIGMLLGTAAYMSPEQARGKRVDSRTDIWAFGCILYEMLSGGRLFDGDDVAVVLASIIKTEPDYSKLPHDVPAAVRSMLRACLQKEPADRIRNIGDVRLGLDGVFLADAPTDTTSGRRWRSAVVALGLGVAGVVIGALVGMNRTPFMNGTSVENLSYTVAINPPADAAIGQRVTGQDHNLAMSPDGNRVAFVATDSTGRQQLWIRELNAPAPRPLEGTQGADSPFWSPDGRFIAFFADRKLQRISSTGGVPVVLCECSGNYGGGGTWNRDDVIVFAGGGSIHRILASGGEPELVVPREGPNSFEWPVFLPDGDHFLYRGPGNLTYVRSLSSGNEKVVGAGANAQFAGGHLVFWRDGVLLAQPFDESSLVLGGEPVRLAEAVPGGPGGGAYSISLNGHLIYQTGNSISLSTLTWFDRNGRPLGTVGEDENYGDVQLSPDGMWAAASTLERSENGRDLWLYEVARGLRTRITHERGHDRSLIWSPDGQRVLFSSARTGSENLYWTAAKRLDRPEVLLADAMDKFPLDWSADGRYIVFAVNAGTSPTKSNDIWVLPLFGDRRPYALLDSRFDDSSAQLSPDGRWIAYTSDESGEDEVYVTSFPTPGTRLRVSVAGGDWPRWRNDGAEIFFRSNPPRQAVMSASFSVQSGQVEIGRATELFTVRSRSNQRYMFDVSPDGNRFLVNVTPDLDPSDSITLVINWRALLQQ